MSQRETKRTARATVVQLLEQFRLVRRALVHPKVPWHAKAVAGCAFVYIVSPIQLIPNFIPIVGQMDDVVALMLAIRYLKRNVPQAVLDECRNNPRASESGKPQQGAPLSDPKSAITTAGTA
jgi:uncharacterized membrane protein YkvA (DUF1232 family)